MLRIRQGDSEPPPAAVWIIGRDDNEVEYSVLYAGRPRRFARLSDELQARALAHVARHARVLTTLQRRGGLRREDDPRTMGEIHRPGSHLEARLQHRLPPRGCNTPEQLTRPQPHSCSVAMAATYRRLLLPDSDGSKQKRAYPPRTARLVPVVRGGSTERWRSLVAHSDRHHRRLQGRWCRCKPPSVRSMVAVVFFSARLRLEAVPRRGGAGACSLVSALESSPVAAVCAGGWRGRCSKWDGVA